MTKEEQIAKLKKLGDEFIYALIDNPYECPIIIDNKGIIRFMSRYSKRLIGIDPFDQPAVELAKVLTRERLSKPSAV